MGLATMPMTPTKLKEIIVAYDQKESSNVDPQGIQLLKLFYEQHQLLLSLDAAQEWALLQCFSGPAVEQDHSVTFAYLACIKEVCAEPVDIEPWCWWQAINTLQLNQLFHLKNFAAIKSHIDSEGVLDAIAKLQTVKCCDQIHLELMLNHVDTNAITLALCQLAEAGLLNDDTRIALKNHSKPLALATSFKLLAEVNLNNPINQGQLKDVNNAWYIAFVLDFLKQAELLNQTVFERLFLPQHAWLLSSEARLTVWYPLTEADFSEQQLDDLLICSEAEDPITAAADYVAQWNPLETALEENLLRINDSESTHTASVHKTSSESAVKLYNRYGISLTAQALAAERNQALLWIISHYDDDEKNQAALRGMLYVTESTIKYCDPMSNVSLNTLIALVWLAIHDEQCRIGALDDALMLFLEGFYEIERGNNLSVDGVDNGAERDERICEAGAFNKLVEKLQGIHPDCDIYFITNQTASFKLPIVVKEELQRYLAIKASSHSYQAAIDFTDLVNTIERDGLSQIWPVLEPLIRTRMFEEFHSLYKSIDDPKFNAFIQAGKDSEPGAFTHLQKPLQQSKGYHAYCGEALRSLSFFKPRRCLAAITPALRSDLSLRR